MPYIYLLQEREFIKTKEPIYKIGKTKQENLTRFKQYPKGSKLIIQIECINCDTMETKLLTIFKSRFKQRRDYGLEYFEGDSNIMKNIIINAIDQETPPVIIREIHNNEQHEITYVAGKKHGIKKIFAHTGEIIHIYNYDNDQLHGYEEIYCNNTLQKIKIPWVNGVKHGEEILYKNEQIKATCMWDQDIRNGCEHYYYNNGSIQKKSSYINGKLHGEYIEYYHNGLIKEKRCYINGKLHGECISYYEDGSILLTCICINDKWHGECIQYYNNGSIQKKSSYINDKKHGEYIEYYSNGSIKNKGNYVND